MSIPGPSSLLVPKKEINSEVMDMCGGMTDAALREHTQLLMFELSKRRIIMPKPAQLALPAPPSVTSQNTEELPRIPFRDPKIEYTDEQYLVVHERASGVEYHPETSSYTWNHRLMDTDGIRRTNELNNYHRERLYLINEQEKADNPPPSPPPPPSRFASSSSSGTRNRNEQPKTNRKITITAPTAQTLSKKNGVLRVDCSCSICTKQFTTIRALLDHRKNVHSEQAMLTCGLCNRKFLSHSIYNHLCQEYKVFQCQRCLYSFASHWHREKHRCEGRAPAAEVKEVEMKMKEVEVKEEIEDEEYEKATPLHECKTCDKKYTTTYWLERHVMKCTGPAPKSLAKLTCDICLRVYSCDYWYDRHKKTCNSATPTPAVVLPVKKEPVRCKNCDKEFPQEVSLSYHARYCPGRVVMPVLMPTLTDNTVDMEEPEELEEEEGESVKEMVPPDLMEEGTEDEEEEEEMEDEEEEEEEEDNREIKIQCSICQLECSSVSKLLNHRKNSHGMTAMFTCGLCQKQCNCISSIRRHVNQEYEIYRCKTCGRNCQDSSILQSHDCSKPFKIRDPHLNRLQYGNLKCSSCHASFATSTILYNHRMTCELQEQHLKRTPPPPPPVTSSPVSVNKLPSIGGSRPGTRSYSLASGALSRASPGLSPATSGSTAIGETPRTTAIPGATSGSKDSASTASRATSRTITRSTSRYATTSVATSGSTASKSIPSGATPKSTPVATATSGSTLISASTSGSAVSGQRVRILARATSRSASQSTAVTSRANSGSTVSESTVSGATPRSTTVAAAISGSTTSGSTAPVQKVRIIARATSKSAVASEATSGTKKDSTASSTTSGASSGSIASGAIPRSTPVATATSGSAVSAQKIRIIARATSKSAVASGANSGSTASGTTAGSTSRSTATSGSITAIKKDSSTSAATSGSTASGSIVSGATPRSTPVATAISGTTASGQKMRIVFRATSKSAVTSGATSGTKKDSTASGATSGATLGSKPGSMARSTSEASSAPTITSTAKIMIGSTATSVSTASGSTSASLASRAASGAMDPGSTASSKAVLGANSVVTVKQFVRKIDAGKTSEAATSGSTSEASSGVITTIASTLRAAADAFGSTSGGAINPGPLPPLRLHLKRTRAQSVYAPGEGSADQNLKCSDCNHQATSLSDLALHRHNNHGKEVHSCNFCPRSFPTHRALHDHHMTEVQRYKCSKCDKVFPRKYQFLQHERYCVPSENGDEEEEKEAEPK